MPKFPGAVGQQNNKKRRAKKRRNMSQAEKDLGETTPELVESMTFHRLKQKLLPQLFVHLVMRSQGFEETLRNVAAAERENVKPAPLPET